MFPEMKNKEETVFFFLKSDSGKEAQKLSLKEIKDREKTLLSKFFTSCFAAPFTKPQVRKSMKFIVTLKTLLMVSAANHMNKTTSWEECNHLPISKEKIRSND